MIFQDGSADRLQQHCLSGSRSRHDQSPLAFTDRSRQIHYPSAILFAVKFEVESLFGIQRGEVVEQDFIPRHLGIFVVDLFDLEQGKISFTFFGADLA